MDLLISLSSLIIGFAILLFGGDFLVKSAISLAVRLKISPAAIGLTVIAAGTSAPELVTSLMASLKGSPDIALGNIVGSNTFNILAILGVASLIRPNRVERSLIRIDLPLLIISSFILYFCARGGLIDHIQGTILLVCLAGVLGFTLWRARVKGIEASADEPLETLTSIYADIIYLVIGLTALIGGAQLALYGGIQIGEMIGLSERVIGVTIISVGTGLPELATSAVAAYRGRNDIAVSNVIGSNIFNTLGIAGVASIPAPIVVNVNILNFDMLWMIGITILIFPLVYLGKFRIERATGMLLLSAYVGYITLLLIN